MEREDAIEKISGDPTLEVATTLISAGIPLLSHQPLAALLSPLLPVLATIPASIKYRRRVERALADVNEELTRLRSELQTLTDGQYEFLNESIVTILNTWDHDKLEML